MRQQEGRRWLVVAVVVSLGLGCSDEAGQAPMHDPDASTAGGGDRLDAGAVDLATRDAPAGLVTRDAPVDLMRPGDAGGRDAADAALAPLCSRPICFDRGCPLDGDGDGVIDDCDPCPNSPPNDAGLQVCEEPECPCGRIDDPMLPGPDCKGYAVVAIEPGLSIVQVTSCLPEITSDIGRIDGRVLGVTYHPDDADKRNRVFSFDPEVSTRITDLGQLSRPAAERSRASRIQPGPGEPWTDKMYITDWIGGEGFRIDRMKPDLTEQEVFFSRTTGWPSTATSNLLFSSGGPFGVFAYQVQHRGANAEVVRHTTTVNQLPAVWSTIDTPGNPPSSDARALAFGPGGVWGNNMWIAVGSVHNGFDDTPGGIYELGSDGAVVSTLVSLDSGKLEFGQDMQFDTSGKFGNQLFYKQADGLLVRVSRQGEVTTMLRARGGSARIVRLPDGDLLVTGRRAVFRVSR